MTKTFETNCAELKWSIQLWGKNKILTVVQGPKNEKPLLLLLRNLDKRIVEKKMSCIYTHSNEAWTRDMTCSLSKSLATVFSQKKKKIHISIFNLLFKIFTKSTVCCCCLQESAVCCCLLISYLLFTNQLFVIVYQSDVCFVDMLSRFWLQLHYLKNAILGSYKATPVYSRVKFKALPEFPIVGLPYLHVLESWANSRLITYLYVYCSNFGTAVTSHCKVCAIRTNKVKLIFIVC